MITSIEEKQSIFLKCKKSVLELVGWKSFIFLPQNFVWRYFIIFSVIISAMVNITCCFHKVNANYADIIRLSCDAGYLVDVILATMHFAMKRTRKLRYGKKRNGFLLILDYLSLLPLTIIFGPRMYKIESEYHSISCYLNLNQFLRIYQVPKSFSDIKQFVYKVRTYIIVTFSEVLSYLILFTYILSCFIVSGYDHEEKESCEDDVLKCISKNYIITFGVFGQLFISPFHEISFHSQKVLLLVYYIIGYLFTYAYLFPLALFLSFKYLVRAFRISLKWIHLNAMLKNMIEDKKLKGKILNQVHYALMYGKGDQRPEILNDVPPSLRKNIFCDMHWEAIRHSQFFRDISMGCKRSLALCMSTEFLTSETILFKQNEINFYFIYVESGSIQIMSSENSESPVINLSSGTVIGEMSFFLQVESKATLRVAQLSAIHLLHFRDFYRVLADYPNDMKTIIHKMKTRLKLAKSLFINKTKIKPQFAFDEESKAYSVFRKQGNFKWLKEQSRALFDLERANKLKVKNLTPESIANYEHQLQMLKTQVDHTSSHFPHICINDVNINKFEAVCLNASFPWMINPECHFFRVWKLMIFFLAIITALLYPPIIGWIPRLPQWFFDVSVVVSVMNITDVLLQLITAVKIKNTLISKFSAVLVYRSSTPSFWADIVAALPFQFLITSEIKHTDFAWNFYFINVLLKAYKMISAFRKWTYMARPGAFIRVGIKYVFFFVVFIVWSSAMFNYIIEDWDMYEDSEWYHTLKETTDLPLSIVASVVKALFTVLKIPGSPNERKIFTLFFISTFFSNFFHLYFIVMISECIAVYVLESTFELEYKNSMKYIYDYLGKNNLTGQIRNRVIEAMKFQLEYEKGNSITDENNIIDLFSMDLKKHIIRESLFQVVAKSKLFELEDEKFQLDLCRKAVSYAVPKNSVLLTFGTKPMGLFVIQKGFIQINSFISGDVHMNVSTPVVAKEGDAFPVIDAFSQSPSAVTAIAITDCKLIQLDLEDILSTMIIHGVLKDLVEAVKTTNLSALSSAKLGISPIQEDSRLIDKSDDVVLKKFQWLKFLFTIFIREKAIDSQSDWYVRWETTRFLFLTFGLFSWPVVFGFSATSHDIFIIIVILFSIDCVTWIDFYIRLHTAYYNQRGICVTNTWYTSLHYLSSSFIADFIAFAPSFHIIWCFVYNTNYDFDFGVVIIHLLMRSVSFYRIIGFLKYLNHRNIIYHSRILQVFLFTTLIIHSYVNMQLYMYFNKMKILSNKAKRLTFNEFVKYYFAQFGLVFSMILKNVHHFEDFKLIDLVLTILFAIFGFFLRIYIYGNITLRSLISEKDVNFYQYYMKSFIQYLSHEKANEHLMNFVTEYIKNDWEMQGKHDLDQIFARFPRTLHEDIAYPLYKKTFSGVESLSGANEAFYRILARNVEEFYLQKGSLIIYKNQVQGDIFFIHKGKCFVETLSKILYKGSVIGDFQSIAVMKNTVTAKTNVQLLKISSEAFLLAISNFYYTKLAFQSEAAKAENFIASIYKEEEEDSLEAFVIDNPDEKSTFIPTDDKKSYIDNYVLKKRRFILNPDSLTSLILDYFFLFIVYITLLVIPIFVVFKIFSPIFLSVVYLLDVIWIVKIALNLRTGFYDEKTRNFIFDKKAIRRRYMRLRDGFVTHFLSVLPMEIFPCIYFGFEITDICCTVMSFFYMNRLLRGTFLLSSKKQDKTKLLTNFFKGFMKVLIIKLILINFCVSFDMLLKDNEKKLFNKCYWDLQQPHKDAIVTSYFWVVNINADEHHHKSHQSDDYLQSLFRMFLSICAFLSKVFLLNEVLIIMIVKYKIKSDEMLKLENLEDYLMVRDVSPILFKRTRNYICYLLNTFKENAEPLYLRTAPTFIRAKIMQEFYTRHFLNCFPFQGIDEIFVKQLAERLERYVFFPGDYITEKGDVDHNIYFIHKGEVYCIETDKNIRDLENTVDLYVTGENFGVLQGILPVYPHTNTYRAKTLSDVLVLNYYKWKDLRIAFPKIAEIIHEKCLEYESIQKTHKTRKIDKILKNT